MFVVILMFLLILVGWIFGLFVCCVAWKSTIEDFDFVSLLMSLVATLMVLLPIAFIVDRLILI